MNVVLTCYFNSKLDPQRNEYWAADDSQLKALRDSVAKNNQQLIVFSDCLDGDDVIRCVPAHSNPYYARWYHYLEYLKQNPNIDKVWMVDATDVVMIKPPFDVVQYGMIYFGDETVPLDTPWMREKHPAPFLQAFFHNKRLKLLNAGVIGGSRGIIIDMLTDFCIFAENYAPSTGETDMAIFNYLMYTKYKKVLYHGDPITTEFKAYDKRNKRCYWRHK